MVNKIWEFVRNVEVNANTIMGSVVPHNSSDKEEGRYRSQNVSDKTSFPKIFRKNNCCIPYFQLLEFSSQS